MVNCAGPFATTAAPVIEAALRAGIPYVDVAAEIEANADTFAHFAGRARDAGAVIVPAMAFFGGLGDLLATAAMGGWTAADEAHIAYGLSGWNPTDGTRAAGEVSRERRDGGRVRYVNGHLEYRDDSPPTLEWPFPPRWAGGRSSGSSRWPTSSPFPATWPSPRCAPTWRSRRPGTCRPRTRRGRRGRRAGTVRADLPRRRRPALGGRERRAVASGQDIYAVTAPLVVEAVDRILTGRTRTAGVASAGEIFDAPDFLRALSPHMSVEL